MRTAAGLAFSDAFIGGGVGSRIRMGAEDSLIAGGTGHDVHVASSFVGGGNQNVIENAANSLIAGGSENRIAT